MRSLFLILTVCFLTSCATQKACERRFPCVGHDSLVYKDSVIIKYDTIIVPAFEFSFDTSGFIPDTISFKHTVKKNNLTATVNIKKGKLTVTCREDSLRAVIESYKRTITERNSSVIIKTQTVYKYNWYDKPSYCLSILFLMLTAFWIGKRFVKP